MSNLHHCLWAFSSHRPTFNKSSKGEAENSVCALSLSLVPLRHALYMCVCARASCLGWMKAMERDVQLVSEHLLHVGLSWRRMFQLSNPEPEIGGDLPLSLHLGKKSCHRPPRSLKSLHTYTKTLMAASSPKSLPSFEPPRVPHPQGSQPLSMRSPSPWLAGSRRGSSAAASGRGRATPNRSMSGEHGPSAWFGDYLFRT